MSTTPGSYLESYGAGEQKRERLFKGIAIVLGASALIGGLGWVFLHNYKEDARASEFVELLKKKDHPAAYALWGCTVAQPCRDYNYQRFQEDWAAGVHADASALRIEKVRSCTGGVIRRLKYPADEVLIFVNRRDLLLGFPPWGDACEVRLKTPG